MLQEGRSSSGSGHIDCAGTRASSRGIHPFSLHRSLVQSQVRCSHGHGRSTVTGYIRGTDLLIIIRCRLWLMSLVHTTGENIIARYVVWAYITIWTRCDWVETYWAGDVKCCFVMG